MTDATDARRAVSAAALYRLEAKARCDGRLRSALRVLKREYAKLW